MAVHSVACSSQLPAAATAAAAAFSACRRRHSARCAFQCARLQASLQLRAAGAAWALRLLRAALPGWRCCRCCRAALRCCRTAEQALQGSSCHLT